MNNIIISIPGATMAESMKMVLEKTGNFRVHLLAKEERGDILRICQQKLAERLLLYVSVTPGFTMEEQKKLCSLVRVNRPNIKIAVLVDELVAPESAEVAKQLKQDGMIDTFLYASSGLAYLTAMLETM